MEIIQPEFEVDVRPEKEGTLVRIIDLTEGKMKSLNCWVKNLRLNFKEMVEGEVY